MDAATHRRLTVIIAGIASLGALISILAYFDNKRDKEMKMEIMSIDKEIKELDLAHKKNVVKG